MEGIRPTRFFDAQVSRLFSIVLVLAVVLSACGGPIDTVPLPLPTLAPLELTGPITQVLIPANSTPIASSTVGDVLPLFSIPIIPTNYGVLGLQAWGTTDEVGDPVNLLEMAVTGGDSNGSAVYIFFDSAGRVAGLKESHYGYSIQLSYDADQITGTLCDTNLKAIETMTVTFDANGNPQGQPVDGGTCQPTNLFGHDRVANSRQHVFGASTSPATVAAWLALVEAIVQDVATAAGLAFVLTSFFKFHQHEMQPTQVGLSQGVTLVLQGQESSSQAQAQVFTLLFIGIGIAIFPTLLSAAANGVSGGNGGSGTGALPSPTPAPYVTPP